jgi:hypothetical protein
LIVIFIFFYSTLGFPERCRLTNLQFLLNLEQFLCGEGAAYLNSFVFEKEPNCSLTGNRNDSSFALGNNKILVRGLK